ncbi:peroxisomal biogenesis factor 11 [Cantharellus anzutake]|uniref:peroxisomal biogenesis factor 11 n=1 Tax=Cantharellus anzutake TaxID=1750568 RepID=UPI0019061EFB|nr:peroxisomal biogenesis factor 11 [Cantharellus anzutake]KAF8329148.1 peroxisomal biogenesis factor 11 [Cantharellus anzutake]
MSDLATQIVFHPNVNRSLKLWSTTVGRDKTYRTIQYFSRFLAWYLLQRDNKDLAARLTALKSALGSGRKLMRLFKPIEHAQAALKAVSSVPYPIEQFTTIGRQLGYFGYLSLDMVVWANSIKFLRLDPETAKKVNKTSQRFWLSGILFSILCGLAKTGRLASEIQSLDQSPHSSAKGADDAERKVQIRALQAARASARYQLVQDSLDIWLPVTSLELAKLNEGTLGLIGTITSLMALRVNWAKTA